MNDNVIYVIYHSPNVNILSKGRILKENKTKIYGFREGRYKAERITRNI